MAMASRCHKPSKFLLLLATFLYLNFFDFVRIFHGKHKFDFVDSVGLSTIVAALDANPYHTAGPLGDGPFESELLRVAAAAMLKLAINWHQVYLSAFIIHLNYGHTLEQDT